MEELSAEAVALFREELLLCGVGPSEVVAVLSSEGTIPGRAEGFAHAARSLGALAYVVTLPSRPVGPGTTGRTPLADYPDVVDLLKKADLVIDLVKLLFSDEQLELQAAGCRILMCIEPLSVLRRLLPTRELRDAVERAVDRLSGTSELRVSSERGTDLSYALGPYGIVAEYGYTDEAGRWDHWPAGFLFTHAADDGVNGTLVLGAGDLLLLPIARYVRDEVTFTIRDGYVVDISGTNLDAMFVRDFFEGAESDREALAISHIGWGLNAAARWSMAHVEGSMYMDARAYAGNVLFSTGPNREVGGSRDTPFHLDVPMRDCTLLLDGDPVVETGRLCEIA